MSKEISLKPCPFCGSDAEFEIQDEMFRDPDDELIHMVICRICCVNTGWFPSPETAAKAWNTRV